MLLNLSPCTGQPPTAKDDLIQRVNGAPTEKLLFPFGDSVPIPQMGDSEQSCGFLFVCICFWLHRVFIAGHELSLAAATGGYSLLWFLGSSLWGLLLFQGTDSGHAGINSCSVQAQWLWLTGSMGSDFVVHGLSLSTARGIFPDQGLNPCTLHWQEDSYPLHHQGSP